MINGVEIGAFKAGKQRSNKYVLQTGSERGSGVEGVVYGAAITLRRPNRVRTYYGLVFKEFRSDVECSQVAATLLKLYEKCKKVGLPVPTTYRLVGRTDSIYPSGFLITDLAPKGGFVISVQDIFGPIEDPKNYANPLWDNAAGMEIFKKVNLAKVAEDVRKIAETAGENKIHISNTDALLLVVDSKGEAKVVISDPASLVDASDASNFIKGSKRLPIPGGKYSSQAIADDNILVADRFVKILQKYQQEGNSWLQTIEPGSLTPKI